MAVTAEQVEQLRSAQEASPGEALPGFDNLSEVMAYVIALARAGDMPEDDAVELVARGAEFTQAELRKIIGTLAPLGYNIACTRLRKLARRKHCR